MVLASHLSSATHEALFIRFIALLETLAFELPILYNSPYYTAGENNQDSRTMNNKILPIIIIILVLVAIVGYVAFANKSNNSQGMIEEMSHAGTHQMPDGSMMHGAETSMGHMMASMVTSERSFIEGMIPHHQEAVDTAREVIDRGATTPEVKKLVENIVAAQEKEIADMKAWNESWYGEPYVDTGKYEPMMRELKDLSGESLDRAFLEDMIMHHMGAMMMAQSVQSYVEHEEIEALARSIIDTQSTEIAEMRKMLQELQ